MGGLYQELLKDGLPKSKALQKIQQAMISGGIKYNSGSKTLDISGLNSTNLRIPMPPNVPDVVSGFSSTDPTIFQHPYEWASFSLTGNPW
jgi:CHAT domain-containing protein